MTALAERLDAQRVALNGIAADSADLLHALEGIDHETENALRPLVLSIRATALLALKGPR